MLLFRKIEAKRCTEMELLKVGEDYFIKETDKFIGSIRTYQNPFHLGRCYLKFDMASKQVLSDLDCFSKISTLEQKPLQVMLSSLDFEKALFLEEEGFKKLRQCYELEVKEDDLLVDLSMGEVEISLADSTNDLYLKCAMLLFDYYKSTHLGVNPLTASFDEFIVALPKTVYFLESENVVLHAAFIENSELAYVCTSDLASFDLFARSVIYELFKIGESISFEADDVDPAAMHLKSLFKNGSDETFDTWVYKKETA